jgi:hypothetical protein
MSHYLRKAVYGVLIALSAPLDYYYRRKLRLHINKIL